MSKVTRETAEQHFSKEAWVETTSAVIKDGLKQLFAEQDADKEKSEKALETILGELSRLCDEKYERVLELVKECMEETYSDEQLKILSALCEQHPWVLERGRAFTVAVHLKTAFIGTEISDAMSNSDVVDNALEDL